MNKSWIPVFSIVIPSLNEEKYLPNLLKDLSGQSFKNFEVILVDAKSEDRTIDKATLFKSHFQGFKIIQTDKRNVSHQRNLGASKSRGNWIIFFDADNRLPSYFLQGIKYLVEKHNPDLLSAWIEPDSKDIKDRAIATLTNIAIDIQKNTSNPFLIEAFVCAKKTSFNKLVGFDESLDCGEGCELLKRAYARKMRFILSRELKYVYSYRRLQKQGHLQTLRNNAQIELARLTNQKLPSSKTKILYPMEGGKYFEISPENRVWIRRFTNEVMRISELQPKNTPLHVPKSLLGKVFSHLTLHNN